MSKVRNINNLLEEIKAKLDWIERLIAEVIVKSESNVNEGTWHEISGKIIGIMDKILETVNLSNIVLNKEKHIEMNITGRITKGAAERLIKFSSEELRELQHLMWNSLKDPGSAAPDAMAAVMKNAQRRIINIFKCVARAQRLNLEASKAV